VLAQEFFGAFSPSLEPLHSTTIHRLSTLRLPSHIQSDEIAQQFRNEKYTVRMSRSGFALLLGWLTEGIGGEAPGAGDGFFGEKGRRGRAAVMRVVNNHLRFDGEFGLRICWRSAADIVPTRHSRLNQRV
jgi:transcription initiation factor TFIID subunit 5